MKTIFVSGSRGFVGRNLIERMKDSYKVVECDLPECDITSLDCLTKKMAGCDAVVHLAAKTKAYESLGEPHTYIDTNVMGTTNVLEAMRLNGIKRLVYTSSCGVKGYKEGSPYLWAKHISEIVCEMYAKLYGMEIIILRPTNIYGPHNWKGVIWHWIERKKKNEVLLIHGDGKQTRDFIHVYDVCDAIMTGLVKPNPKIITVEIGTGIETSLIGLAKKIGGKYALTGDWKKVGLRRSVANTKPAEKYLKFKAKISLDDGIKS